MLKAIRKFIFKLRKDGCPRYRGECAGSEWVDIFRLVQPTKDELKKADPIDLITGYDTLGRRC